MQDDQLFRPTSWTWSKLDSVLYNYHERSRLETARQCFHVADYCPKCWTLITLDLITFITWEQTTIITGIQPGWSGTVFDQSSFIMLITLNETCVFNVYHAGRRLQWLDLWEWNKVMVWRYLVHCTTIKAKSGNLRPAGQIRPMKA